MVPELPIFTIGFLQEKYLRAIFGSLIDGQRVGADSFASDDFALVTAESFLWRHPDRHIAIILETWSEDGEKIRETYEAGCHRIRRSVPSRERWHVALAIPSFQKWALIDDHIRQEYEQIRQEPCTASTPEERKKIEQSNFYHLAMKIGDWVAEQPFDLESLKRQSRQVRELCTFIEKSLEPKPEPEPVTAENWF